MAKTDQRAAGSRPYSLLTIPDTSSSLLCVLTELDVVMEDCEMEESDDEDKEDQHGNY